MSRKSRATEHGAVHDGGESAIAVQRWSIAERCASPLVILEVLTSWLSVERLPGTFLLSNREVRKTFRNKLVSHRPAYLGMAVE